MSDDISTAFDTVERVLNAFPDEDERHWELQAFLLVMLSRKAQKRADDLRQARLRKRGTERPAVHVDVSDWDSTEGAAYDKPAEHFNLSPQEWKAAAEAHLAELGCTYTELEAMSRPGGYWRSMRHRKLWVLIGGTLDEEKTDG